MVNDNKTLLQSDLVRLGSRLRFLRTQRGWTLGELARRTNLSEAYLSRIESGDRQPSLAVLFELARTYHTSMAALFEVEPPSSAVVVRSVDANVYEGNGLLYSLLSNKGSLANLHPIHVTIPAQRQNECLYQHEGEEWLYVLSGELRLTLGEEEHILQPFDAAHFDAGIPHRLDALGDRDTEILLVSCEASHALLRSYL
ncbi:MAG: helix-turn-helix transcriptional regulator [Chlorogloeopsis fritschii C42_A2020_084]|jgi:transcriptional regulator with XRE-family HTH domain|uniref:helix-turn-helix domain-containing protein n=1 Tax=Chlorogloeopsis fritschii TaxID=1124 RepID=UPI0019DFD4B8|nr:XRE family transcriptional regulator [Chlorogloeopsis fritschii]MBF2008290.1 helix-turn-helix transcriptional regulator [Chlorogloeopsis fritschii C42_A2020_084]